MELGEIRTQVSGNKINLVISDKVTTATNYLRLTNKPSINSIELTGNKTAKELNLLSNNSNSYKQTTLKSVSNTDFLLLLNNLGETKKAKINEITSHFIETRDEIDDDLEIGNYIFLLKKESINGSNKK